MSAHNTTFARYSFTYKQHKAPTIAFTRQSVTKHSFKPRQFNPSFTPTSHPLQTSTRRPLQVLSAIKKSLDKHIACSKTLHVIPGKENTVESMCKDIVAFTQGRQSDKTNGILSFSCSKDPYEPNLYHFWEIYESNLSLGRHNTTPEMKAFMENIQKYLEQPVGMALYEMKDGQIGAVATQGGPKGEGGLDDATGASKTAGGAGYRQTSSAVDLTNIKEEEEEDKGLWGIKFEFPWMKNNKK